MANLKTFQVKRFLGFLIIGACLLAVPGFGYEYGGYQWYDIDLPVDYWIHQNGTADCENEFVAIQASFQAWEDVKRSYMDFNYRGTTEYEAGTYDGYNVCSWKDPWPYQAEATAMTSIWIHTGSDRILECDIEFNDQHFTWSSSGEAGKMDVQNVTTHEAGHWLYLLDLYGAEDAEKTMYGYVEVGETKKRTLEPDDEEGIRFIYPTVLSSDSPVSRSKLPCYYSYTQSNACWAIVGLRPEEVSYNNDIYLYSDIDYTTLLASSTGGAGVVDFIVQDFHHSTPGTYYPKVSNGLGIYQLEWYGGARTLTVGTPTSYTVVTTHVVDIWDISLESGKRYKFEFTPVSGSCDLGIGLFKSNGSAYAAGREAAVASADSHGAGAGESFTYECTSTDYYGFVIWNNGGDYDQAISILVSEIPTLTVSGTAMEPVSLVPGQAGAVMEKLTLIATSGSVTVNSIKIDESGSSTTDTDVSSVKLYDDANNNGQVDVGETLLGSGSFSSQTVTISGLNYTVEAGTPRNILIVYDISSSANTGVTLGAKLANNTYVTVASPAEVLTTNFPIVSDNWLIYKWVRELAPGYGIESSATIRGGRVFVGCDDGKLYVLDADDGTEKATYATSPSGAIKSGIVVTQAPAKASIYDVYFSANNCRVYHLYYDTSNDTFSEAWIRGLTPAIPSMPAPVGGYVYVGCSDNTLHQLNAADGTDTSCSPKNLSYPIASSASVQSDLLFIGVRGGSGKVYKLRTSDLTSVAEFDAGTAVSASTFLDAENGTVYIGSESGYFYALPVSTFTIPRWTYSVGSAIKSSAFIDVVTKRAYFGTEEGRVYCLENIDTTVPKLLWKYPPEGSPAIGAVRTCPVVYNGVVYFGSEDNYFYALDASDGSLKWRTKTGGPVSASPAIGSGVVSIGSADGKVYTH